MITALSIRDFVLAGKLDLDVGNGFTALTGETGAGKSIILDALNMALGGKSEKRFIRKDAKQASIAVEFAPGPDHPVWAILTEHGFTNGPEEILTCRRVIPLQGAARGFINDEPASAALLMAVGEALVEIHAQHAASALLKPSRHRQCLDLYAGCESLLDTCATAWRRLEDARGVRIKLEEDAASGGEDEDWLGHAVGALDVLAPEAGEAERLVASRAVLMQSGRISEAVTEAEDALQASDMEANIIRATRAMERVSRLPGIESAVTVHQAAVQAGEALERMLIEMGEAGAQLGGLGTSVDHDGEALEQVETRLFALRAEARKHEVEVDALPELLEALRARLEGEKAREAALSEARKSETRAAARWHGTADKLSAARKAASGRFEKAVEAELKPLKLAGLKLKIEIEPLPEAECGAGGIDRIEFAVETNPGGGFGPLRRIASGGELARFSLALCCALAQAGGAQTLIFDEADQGVGGAVAAAIGKRLARLAKTRQVFAITHSPQVAASGASQWLVEKRTRKTGLGETRIRSLDADARTEEIARMLSGAKITTEARAAATRLLEGP